MKNQDDNEARLHEKGKSQLILLIVSLVGLFWLMSFDKWFAKQYRGNFFAFHSLVNPYSTHSHIDRNVDLFIENGVLKSNDIHIGDSYWVVEPSYNLNQLTPLHLQNLLNLKINFPVPNIMTKSTNLSWTVSGEALTHRSNLEEKILMFDVQVNGVSLTFSNSNKFVINDMKSVDMMLDLGAFALSSGALELTVSVLFIPSFSDPFGTGNLTTSQKVIYYYYTDKDVERFVPNIASDKSNPPSFIPEKSTPVVDSGNKDEMDGSRISRISLPISATGTSITDSTSSAASSSFVDPINYVASSTLNSISKKRAESSSSISKPDEKKNNLLVLHSHQTSFPMTFFVAGLMSKYYRIELRYDEEVFDITDSVRGQWKEISPVYVSPLDQSYDSLAASHQGEQLIDIKMDGRNYCMYIDMSLSYMITFI